MAEQEARRTLGRSGQNGHSSHSYPFVTSFLPSKTRASGCLHPRMSLPKFSFPKCMQSRVFLGGDPGCRYTLCCPPWFLLKHSLSVAWKSPSRQAIPRDLLVSASALLSPRSHLHGFGLELRACALCGECHVNTVKL